MIIYGFSTYPTGSVKYVVSVCAGRPSVVYAVSPCAKSDVKSHNFPIHEIFINYWLVTIVCFSHWCNSFG